MIESLDVSLHPNGPMFSTSEHPRKAPKSRSCCVAFLLHNPNPFDICRSNPSQVTSRNAVQ